MTEEILIIGIVIISYLCGYIDGKKRKLKINLRKKLTQLDKIKRSSD